MVADTKQRPRIMKRLKLTHGLARKLLSVFGNDFNRRERDKRLILKMRIGGCILNNPGDRPNPIGGDHPLLLLVLRQDIKLRMQRQERTYSESQVTMAQ